MCVGGSYQQEEEEGCGLCGQIQLPIEPPVQARKTMNGALSFGVKSTHVSGDGHLRMNTTIMEGETILAGVYSVRASST